MQIYFNKTARVCALILTAAFIVYFNSFGNKFIYDDIPLIVENQYLKDWKYLPKLLTSDMWAQTNSLDKGAFAYYRPLPMVSFLIDNSLWGLKPQGYHFVNTLFHSANGALVFLIVNVLTGSVFVAGASGLLFVTHPAQTEAVSFISSRGEVLFLFFSLLTIYLFIKSRTLFSAIAFSLSLLSKETALITPVILLLVCLYFTRDKLRLKNFLPFITIIIFYLFLRNLVLPPVQYPGAILNSLNRFFFTMTRGAAIYLKILLIPANPSIDYSLSPQVSILEFSSLLSIVLFFSLIIAALLYGKKFKALSFSVLWFYAGLIPASHILYRLPYLVAERQLYLPSIGYCVFAGWILSEAYKKYQKAAVVCFAAILLLFSAKTINRNFDWGDEILLWGGALKQFPESANSYMNIGAAFDDRGDYQNAINHYQKALSINDFPYVEYVRLKLAGIYKRTERFDLALNEYFEILRLNPAARNVHNNIGNIYFRMGRLDSALEEYRLEIKSSPAKSAPYINIGAVYAMKKNYMLAEKYFKAALQIDPSSEDAKRNLRLLLEEK